MRRYRFFFLFGEAADVKVPVQRLNMSLVALDTAAVDCRFASEAILARAELATEWALLSHMLMNGFFFNQGFDIRVSFVQPRCGLRSLSPKSRSLRDLPMGSDPTTSSPTARWSAMGSLA